MNIKCEHPVVLLNPKYRHFTRDGFTAALTPIGLYRFLDQHLLEPKRLFPRRCGLS